MNKGIHPWPAAWNKKDKHCSEKKKKKKEIKKKKKRDSLRSRSAQKGILKWNSYWVISHWDQQECKASMSHKTTAKTSMKRPHVSAEHCRWISSERSAAAYDCNINNGTQQRCSCWFMFTFNPERKRRRRRQRRKKKKDNEINNKRPGPSDKLLFIPL